MRERVLLFPGLGEPAMKMAAMSYWLQLAGFETEIIDYPSTKGTAEQLIEEYIGPALRSRRHIPVLHCVTNSLGGVLLRGFLAEESVPNLGRVVMICPGHHGSAFLEVLRHNPIAAMLLGPILQQSGNGKEAFPLQLPASVDFDLGIVAGGLSMDPIAYSFAPEMQDGRVTVASSKINGMKDHTVLPIPHKMLSQHPLTGIQVIAYLQHGKFIASSAIPDFVKEAA